MLGAISGQPGAFEPAYPLPLFYKCVLVVYSILGTLGTFPQHSLAQNTGLPGLPSCYSTGKSILDDTNSFWAVTALFLNKVYVIYFMQLESIPNLILTQHISSGYIEYVSDYIKYMIEVYSFTKHYYELSCQITV